MKLATTTLALLAGLAPLAALPAAAGTTTATLLGTVKDPAGNPVAGAEVEAVLAGFGTRLALQSDAKGRFMQVGVKPGIWELTVRKSGHADWRNQVKLALGSRVPVEVVLEPASASAGAMGGEAGRGFALGDVKLSKESAGAYRAAQEALGAGKMDEARSALERVIDLEPALASPYFVLAQIHRDAGDPRGAADLLRRGLEREPREVSAWIALGEVESETGSADAAIAAFEKAAAAAPPGDPRPYRKLGMARVVQQDFAGAVQALERYLELAPDAADAAEKRALLEECRKLAQKK